MTIEINETNRKLYGGDEAVLQTIPAVHPRSGIPLPGTRESIKGASQYWTTFFRGDIIYKDDPTRKFCFTRWDDDGSANSRKMWLHLTVERHYAPCEGKDWLVAPELKPIIEEVDGQLVTRLRRNLAGKDEYQIIMFVPYERWLLDQKALCDTNILAQNDAMVGQHLDDKRVSVLPTTVEVTPHKYDVSDVAIKKRK